MKLSKLAVTTLGGLLVSTTLIAGTVKPINDPSYLFIQNAKSATLQAVENQPGQYRVTLKEPKKDVTYFSRRPVRTAGKMPIRAFINQWKPNKYGKVAPNAGLTGVANRKPVTVALVLSQPNYNAETNTLVYSARLLGNKQTVPQKIKVKHPALLIDQMCFTCAAF